MAKDQTRRMKFRSCAESESGSARGAFRLPPEPQPLSWINFLDHACKIFIRHWAGSGNKKSSRTGQFKTPFVCSLAERATGAEKASFREAVGQNGVFGESILSSPLVKVALKQAKTSGQAFETCCRQSSRFWTTASPNDPKGSKRCFPNGVFQISHLGLQQRKTMSEGKTMSENTSVAGILEASALADPDDPLDIPL